MLYEIRIRVYEEGGEIVVKNKEQDLYSKYLCSHDTLDYLIAFLDTAFQKCLHLEGDETVFAEREIDNEENEHEEDDDD